MASQGRKPNPKTQREISVGLQTPYDKAGLGNPNDSYANNRATRTSFRGDTTKPFTLGIADIDESIMYYIQEIIKPTVFQNGERLAVPVIYGNPEKWSAVQRDGYYRDKNGKVMCPIMMIKRESVEKVRTITTKLDANQPNLYATMVKGYSPKNAYSNFDALNNRIPIKENYLTVIPDYVQMRYTCMIMTYYTEQLNKVVEAMNYASDSYWGDPSRFKFKAKIDSFNTVVESEMNAERVAKSTFDIILNGYLVPDTLQKDLTAVKKFNSKAQVTITAETTGSL